MGGQLHFFEANRTVTRRTDRLLVSNRHYMRLRHDPGLSTWTYSVCLLTKRRLFRGGQVTAVLDTIFSGLQLLIFFHQLDGRELYQCPGTFNICLGTDPSSPRRPILSGVNCHLQTPPPARFRYYRLLDYQIRHATNEELFRSSQVTRLHGKIFAGSALILSGSSLTVSSFTTPELAFRGTEPSSVRSEQPPTWRVSNRHLQLAR